jgi:hypothetical protein
VDYQMREDMWAISEVQHVDAYDMDIACSFMIRYPVLENAGKHTDEINQLLQNTAKQTVRTYYEDPDQDTIERFRRLVAESGDFKPSNADALLSSTVDYAITYNNDRLLSVCFSDSYYLGSDAGGFIQLRTVNVDLRTGKVYELDDVLSVDRVVASSFVDNLLRTNGEDANGDGRIEDDECFTVKLVGREALVEALQGTGELAENGRVSTCLFVDGNGQPNLGANYWLSSDGGFVRGWWDVTISDAQLEDVRKESKFWKLLDK